MNQLIRRRMARAASTAVMAILLASFWPAPSHAMTDGDEAAIAVDLTRLEPAAPQPGDTVTLSGTVTNLGDDVLENVQALFRYHSRPIQSRSEVARIADDPRLYWGWRPGHIFDAVSGSLAPHQSAPFQLEMTLDSHCSEAVPDDTPCLALSSPGVYAIGVDVNVTPADGARTTAATARTVLPWNITADPIDVALLWPIASTPGAVDDRQHTVIEAAAGRPVTWAIDPDYASSTCVEDDCALYDAMADADDVIVLPAAVPDLGALAGIDAGVAAEVAAQSALAQRQFLATTTELRTARSDLAWLDNSTVSAAAVDIWSDAGYTTTVVPADAVVPPVGGALARIDDQLAVLTDIGLSSALADAVDDGSALQLRQRWLAETAMAAGEPAESAAVLAATPPLGWQPTEDVAAAVLDVWTGTDWITPVGLSDLDAEALPPAALEAAADSGGSGLPADYAQSVVAAHHEIEQYERLLAEPAEPSELLTGAQVASTTWQNDLAGGREALSDLQAAVSSALEDVSIVVNPMNTLSSNTGVFPVNIANNLEQAIDVRVDFEPDNRDRMSIPPIETQRVEGGEQVTIQVRAEAVANGQVPVNVQLATVDGAPLGQTQRTIINATQYGTIGWFVVGGSALLFVGGLSWRMMRGRRRHNGDGANADAVADIGTDGDMVTR
jgi:hypothetical protein